MAQNERSPRIGSGIGDRGPTLAEYEALTRAGRDRTDHPARAQQYITEQRTARDAEWRDSTVRTSAAAVFALVFGLSAVLCALSIILAPVALVLSCVGLVLGIVGMRMGRRYGVTGRGLAAGGLGLSILALLLSATIAAGITTVVNNRAAVDRINRQVQKLERNLGPPPPG